MASPFDANSRYRMRVWLAVVTSSIGKDLRIRGRYPLEFAASIFQAFLIMAVVVFASMTFTPPGHGSSPERTVVSGVLVHGYVLFIFLTEIIWGMGYALQQEQRQGTLEQLYLAPAPVSAAIFSRLAILVLWTLFLCVVSLGIVGGLLGRLPLFNPITGLLILVFSISAFCGLGLVFTALSFWLRESLQVITTVIQFGFILLCAPFFPFSALPGALRQAARFSPLSYYVDAYRSTLLGYPKGYPELASIEWELLIIIGCGILLPLLGARLYRMAEAQARDAGTLGAY